MLLACQGGAGITLWCWYLVIRTRKEAWTFAGDEGSHISLSSVSLTVTPDPDCAFLLTQLLGSL